MDGDTFLYRMFLLDPGTGLYMSPFPHDDEDNVVGVLPGGKADKGKVKDIDSGSMDTETMMRLNAERLGRDALDDLNDNYDEYSCRGHYGDLLMSLAGGPGTLGGEQVIVASSPDYKGRLFRSMAPHGPFSALGMAGDGYSIIRGIDLRGGAPLRGHISPNEIEERLSKAKSLSGLLELNRDINGNFLSQAVADNFKQSGLFKDYLSKSKAVQKKMEKNYGYIDFDDIRNIIASSEAGAMRDVITNRQARKDLANFLARESGNYIPASEGGRGFFENPNQLFKDAMHDRLVDSVFETFLDIWGENRNKGIKLNPKNIRLLQVAANADDIVGNGHVLKGNVSSQRDKMNEILVNSFTIDKDKFPNNGDIGSIDELASPNGPIWNYYVNRIRGMSGEDAWKNAMGDKWGNLAYLLSDEEEKDVRKGMRDCLDSYMSRMSILHGIERGPGDG